MRSAQILVPDIIIMVRREIALICLHAVYTHLLHLKAVLVNNTALFILFGKTSANDTTNNVAVLDVRNVSAIQFSDQFPLEGGSTALATETEAKADDPVGLSSGAIAGIIVGAIAAVRLLNQLIVSCSSH